MYWPFSKKIKSLLVNYHRPSETPVQSWSWIQKNTKFYPFHPPKNRRWSKLQQGQCGFGLYSPSWFYWYVQLVHSTNSSWEAHSVKADHTGSHIYPFVWWWLWHTKLKREKSRLIRGELILVYNNISCRRRVMCNLSWQQKQTQPWLNWGWWVICVCGGDSTDE